jgi:hypothetical protein
MVNAYVRPCSAPRGHGGCANDLEVAGRKHAPPGILMASCRGAPAREEQVCDSLVCYCKRISKVDACSTAMQTGCVNFHSGLHRERENALERLVAPLL